MVCEGDGDGPALRVLLPRILTAQGPLFIPSELVSARGRGNLTVPGGVEKYFRLVAPGQDAVLVVLDADDDCPVDLARDLAQRLRAPQPSVPVAIVAANAEFESWFLADLGSIAGKNVKSRVLIPEAGDLPEDPDGSVDPKSKLIALTAAGTTYKETRDQPALASLIDPEVVSGRSRSFRRLLGALRDLAAAVAAGNSRVTPD